MSYTDPDRDQQIADLRRRLDDLSEQYRVTHELWRRGLKAAQTPGARAVDVECALTGADSGDDDVVWARVRTVPGGGGRGAYTLRLAAGTPGTPAPSPAALPGGGQAGPLAAAVVDLARLALAFGRIDRTAVYHPDGATPESDTDHTVMLGWVACALAARFFPALDVGLVAQFALVHDAPEVYAGDTPTLRIDAAGRAAKAAREHAATRRLAAEFGARLPWLPALVGRYEGQDCAEARFVRGVDKVLPKAVHLLDGCAGLREHGMGRAELAGVLEAQRADMAGYVGEFAELMALRAELAGRVLDRVEDGGRHPAGAPALPAKLAGGG